MKIEKKQLFNVRLSPLEMNYITRQANKLTGGNKTEFLKLLLIHGKIPAHIEKTIRSLHPIESSENEVQL
jgi:hypothetical protein